MAKNEMTPRQKEAFAEIAAGCKLLGDALQRAGVDMAAASRRIAEAQRARRATPFDHARAHLMGKRWTEQEAEHLKEIIDQGAAQGRKPGQG